jgi:maleate isomerase
LDNEYIIAAEPFFNFDGYGFNMKWVLLVMTERVFLGMLTPSSNTVLEPVTGAILADLPDVTAHFGRFGVTEISLNEKALGQFENQPIIDASKLLADARLHAILWNGTSSGWLGFDADRKLCEEITKATGIPASTSVLALNEIFESSGVKKFGLVTPYLDEIQDKIIANYVGEGFECVSERHLCDRGNFSFSEVTEETIANMVREVAADKPDAISIFCTNLRGAWIVDALEREIGIPIYDTVSTTLWKAMKLAGADPKRIKGWGRLYSEIN